MDISQVVYTANIHPIPGANLQTKKLKINSNHSKHPDTVPAKLGKKPTTNHRAIFLLLSSLNVLFDLLQTSPLAQLIGHPQ